MQSSKTRDYIFKHKQTEILAMNQVDLGFHKDHRIRHHQNCKIVPSLLLLRCFVQNKLLELHA